MSLLTGVADFAIGVLQKFASKSTVLTTVDGISVTAGGLESSLGTITGFTTAFAAAVKAKNLGSEAELGIEEAATIASDLGVPYAGLAATFLPWIFDAINTGVTLIEDAQTVPDGQGGFIPKSWLADPHVQIDPKTGNFVEDEKK